MIARMILTAIYQILSTGEAWNPSDLYKIDMPAPLIEKQKAKAIKQAMKLLQKPMPLQAIAKIQLSKQKYRPFVLMGIFLCNVIAHILFWYSLILHRIRFFYSFLI